MEDLGQLIFVVLFILFGLISGSKKKKVPPKQRPRRPQVTGDEDLGGDVINSPAVVREPPVTAEKVPTPVAAAGQLDAPGEPKRSLAEELLGMLQQEAAQVEAPVDAVPRFDDVTQPIDTYEAPPSPIHERASEKSAETETEKNPYSKEDTPAPRPYAVDNAPHDRPYLVEQPQVPEPYEIRGRSDQKRYLSRSELRHAIVMKEVLGPPKALED